MKTSYEKGNPALFLNSQDQVEVWHDHKQNYNTSYLYDDTLVAGQKASINNEINLEASKIKGCMEFFNFFKSADIRNLTASAAAARAVGGDSIILKSLTEKNF